MKTILKTLGVIAIVAVIGFVMTACDEDGETESAPKCEKKTNLGIGEECDLYECECELQDYGELFAGGPKIYRVGPISMYETTFANKDTGIIPTGEPGDNDIEMSRMNAAVLRAQYSFEELSSAGKSNFEDENIEEIHIYPMYEGITNASASFYIELNGKRIIGFYENRNNVQMRNYLTWWPLGPRPSVPVSHETHPVVAALKALEK